MKDKKDRKTTVTTMTNRAWLSFPHGASHANCNALQWGACPDLPAPALSSLPAPSCCHQSQPYKGVSGIPYPPIGPRFCPSRQSCAALTNQGDPVYVYIYVNVYHFFIFSSSFSFHSFILSSTDI